MSQFITSLVSCIDNMQEARAILKEAKIPYSMAMDDKGNVQHLEVFEHAMLIKKTAAEIAAKLPGYQVTFENETIYIL